jgi:glycerophosphoryl diester phosphodiesterase
MASITELSRPFLWAHRGASARAPENTLAAFFAAGEDGADGIELDIHLSRDGVPVVIHDDTLTRTTDGAGAVASFSCAELRRLDAGSWFADEFSGEGIPRLDDVLALFGGVLQLNLEVKDAAAGEAVLARLDDSLKTSVVVSSFNVALLRRLRRADGEVRLAVLCGVRNWRPALQAAVELKASAFHPAATIVSQPLFELCRRERLPVSVWTVDDPVAARRLCRLGAAGLFTNRPGALGRAFFRGR